MPHPMPEGDSEGRGYLVPVDWKVLRLGQEPSTRKEDS